ncbi:9722_t:CDS:2 [Acaulospora morrowiae]|uniref:9722_t:CDS:1 n=1 Tax=Acaulospora morrowiae TaxID=94023 RepID=A0A9N9FJI7_9GLOM|nr:9722_t:CDS:2 [Acaulospora morrowiae]
MTKNVIAEAAKMSPSLFTMNTIQELVNWVLSIDIYRTVRIWRSALNQVMKTTIVKDHPVEGIMSSEKSQTVGK